MVSRGGLSRRWSRRSLETLQGPSRRLLWEVPRDDGLETAPRQGPSKRLLDKVARDGPWRRSLEAASLDNSSGRSLRALFDRSLGPLRRSLWTVADADRATAEGLLRPFSTLARTSLSRGSLSTAHLRSSGRSLWTGRSVAASDLVEGNEPPRGTLDYAVHPIWAHAVWDALSHRDPE
jgi:hypothetical protein